MRVIHLVSERRAATIASQARRRGKECRGRCCVCLSVCRPSVSGTGREGDEGEAEGSMRRGSLVCAVLFKGPAARTWSGGASGGGRACRNRAAAGLPLAEVRRRRRVVVHYYLSLRFQRARLAVGMGSGPLARTTLFLPK